jgi:hypothetical protein
MTGHGAVDGFPTPMINRRTGTFASLTEQTLLFSKTLVLRTGTDYEKKEDSLVQYRYRVPGAGTT